MDTEKITIVVPVELATKIRVLSAKTRATLSQFFVNASEAYLSALEAEEEEEEGQAEPSPKDRSGEAVGAAA